MKFLDEWQNQDEARDFTTLVDSEWAGSEEARSGGVIKVGKHVVCAWSSTQPTVATLSREAELIAMSGDADGDDRDGLVAAAEDVQVFHGLFGCEVVRGNKISRQHAALGGEVAMASRICAHGQDEG